MQISNELQHLPASAGISRTQEIAGAEDGEGLQQLPADAGISSPTRGRARGLHAVASTSPR
jgi:hypothetical protein